MDVVAVDDLKGDLVVDGLDWVNLEEEVGEAEVEMALIELAVSEVVVDEGNLRKAVLKIIYGSKQRKKREEEEESGEKRRKDPKTMLGYQSPPTMPNCLVLSSNIWIRHSYLFKESTIREGEIRYRRVRRKETFSLLGNFSILVTTSPDWLDLW